MEGERVVGTESKGQSKMRYMRKRGCLCVRVCGLKIG